MSESIEFDARDLNSFALHATPLRKVAVQVLGVAVRGLVRLEVEGLKNVPADGPIILASNHVSNFDVFPMQLAMPRPIFFMGKAELFRFAPIGAVLRELGAFPVYRRENDAWALRHARRVLDHRQTLGMFPEGTRSRGRGLGIARTGTARLAIEAHCPILPAIVTGSDQLFRFFPLRTQVKITFLPPILPKATEDLSSLTDRLMYTLAAALPEEMRGVYGDVRRRT
jgi:1-acyl-sn-glycerol-3-phosphate acyltransferase